MTAESPTPANLDSTVERSSPRRLGPYILVDELGQGGMGVVYRAVHSVLKKIVAIKIISPGRRGPGGLMRFQKELQALGSLDHPNIVRALDADHDGDVLYLAMEYIHGTDMSRLLKSQGRLSFHQACGIITQAAEGVRYLQRKGFVHRDLKPSNLLLSREGVVKIVDLGLVRAAEDLPSSDRMTETGQVLGTPDFMAPELASGSRNADVRADIYSLGCSLYMMLTGSPPFRSVPGFFEKLRAHAQDTIAPISDTRTDVPHEFQSVLDRMVAKDPSQRFQDPGAILDALAPWAARQDALSTLAQAVAPAAEESADELLKRQGAFAAEVLSPGGHRALDHSSVATIDVRSPSVILGFSVRTLIAVAAAAALLATILAAVLLPRGPAEPWKPKPFLLRNIGKETSWTYEPEQALLRVSTPNDIALIEYGTIAEPEGPYTLSARFIQDGGWKGRVGIYYACQPTDGDATFKYRARVVELAPTDAFLPQAGYQAWHRTLGELRSRPGHITWDGALTNALRFHPGESSAPDRKPTNRRQEHILLLALSADGLNLASWDEEPLPGLQVKINNRIEMQNPAVPFHGAYGVYCDRTSMTVTEFKLQKR